MTIFYTFIASDISHFPAPFRLPEIPRIPEDGKHFSRVDSTTVAGQAGPIDPCDLGKF